MTKHLIIDGALADRIIEVPDPAPRFYDYRYAQPSFTGYIANGDTPVIPQPLKVREERLFLNTFSHRGETISVYSAYPHRITPEFYEVIWQKVKQAENWGKA